MRFWDTSALLSLLAGQTTHLNIMALVEDDTGMVVWWGTRVELVSGACRLRRDGLIDEPDLGRLLSRIEAVTLAADQVEPTEDLRQLAIRVLRVHTLRAADALQLASALVWSQHRPDGAGFVCLDRRLRDAASREGFRVLPEA